MQWSGVLTSGCCNYAYVVAGGSFTAGHVWCVMPLGGGPPTPTFWIYYAVGMSYGNRTVLGACTPNTGIGDSITGFSLEGSATLTAQTFSPGDVLLIQMSGYHDSLNGFSAAVTVGP